MELMVWWRLDCSRGASGTTEILASEVDVLLAGLV
jgi:hypothetical protein